MAHMSHQQVNNVLLLKDYNAALWLRQLEKKKIHMYDVNFFVHMITMISLRLKRIVQQKRWKWVKQTSKFITVSSLGTALVRNNKLFKQGRKLLFYNDVILENINFQCVIQQNKVPFHASVMKNKNGNDDDDGVKKALRKFKRDPKNLSLKLISCHYIFSTRARSICQKTFADVCKGDQRPETSSASTSLWVVERIVPPWKVFFFFLIA